MIKLRRDEEVWPVAAGIGGIRQVFLLPQSRNQQLISSAEIDPAMNAGAIPSSG